MGSGQWIEVPDLGVWDGRRGFRVWGAGFRVQVIGWTKRIQDIGF